MASFCKKCTSEVKSNHNGVACELCNKWFHAKCVGITAEAYKFLKTCSAEASADSSALGNGNGGVMWFCQDCMGPASHMMKNMSAVQKRQDDLEAELKQTTKRMNSIDLEVKENKREADSRVNDNKKDIKELQKEVLDINVKLQMIQDDLAMNNENVKWSDIVTQAVETKFETVQLA